MSFSTSKAAILNRENLLTVAKPVALLLVAFVAPFSHNQMITGSLVNATLFIAAAVLSLESAITIAVLPSLIAVSLGTLPAPLAPMVPFIILSNILLILVVVAFRRLNIKTNFLVKVFLASLVKFIFLLSVSAFVLNFLFHKQLPAVIMNMMSWPQLITALVGGFIAYLIIKGKDLK